MPNCDRSVSHASRAVCKACNTKFDKRKKLRYADGSKKGTVCTETNGPFPIENHSII